MHGLLFSVEKNNLFQIKVSKQEGKNPNLFILPVKDKRFLSLLTNKISAEFEAYRKHKIHHKCTAKESSR